MWNHDTQPTGSTPFPKEVALVVRGTIEKNMFLILMTKTIPPNLKGIRKKKKKGKEMNPADHEDICYWYGMNGHWSRTCHTTKHLVDIFSVLTEDKGKECLENFASQLNATKNNDHVNDVSNDVTHFFMWLIFFLAYRGQINHLIGVGQV